MGCEGDGGEWVLPRCEAPRVGRWRCTCARTRLALSLHGRPRRRPNTERREGRLVGRSDPYDDELVGTQWCRGGLGELLPLDARSCIFIAERVRHVHVETSTRVRRIERESASAQNVLCTSRSCELDDTEHPHRTEPPHTLRLWHRRYAGEDGRWKRHGCLESHVTPDSTHPSWHQLRHRALGAPRTRRAAAAVGRPRRVDRGGSNYCKRRWRQKLVRSSATPTNRSPAVLRAALVPTPRHQPRRCRRQNHLTMPATSRIHPTPTLRHCPQARC